MTAFKLETVKDIKQTKSSSKPSIAITEIKNFAKSYTQWKG